MQAINGETRDFRDLLESVLRRHGDRWLRFVLRVLGNHADAEDAMQEAVRRVLGCSPVLGSEDQVRMYLSRAICNTAIEIYHLRKRERFIKIPVQEYALPDVAAKSPDALLEEREGAIERDHMLEVIQSALAKLPVKQCQALRLTVLESRGMSIRDASEVHGIPYSTLRHQIVQGLRRLRRTLKSASRNSSLKFMLF